MDRVAVASAHRARDGQPHLGISLRRRHRANAEQISGVWAGADAHPELLDWLAAKFIESGWSIKAMHREIMLSAAYRQASRADDAALKADPENRLFGRMNRKRVESEVLRDSLLSAAGRLDLKMGGPSERDAMTPRRMLYLMSIRSDRSSFGPLFDSADSTAQVDKRTISIVAPQSLYLLNNDFALAQVEAFAKRVLALKTDSDDARIAAAYEILYGASRECR